MCAEEPVVLSLYQRPLLFEVKVSALLKCLNMVLPEFARQSLRRQSSRSAQKVIFDLLPQPSASILDASLPAIQKIQAAVPSREILGRLWGSRA